MCFFCLRYNISFSVGVEFNFTDTQVLSSTVTAPPNTAYLRRSHFMIFKGMYLNIIKPDYGV